MRFELPLEPDERSTHGYQNLPRRLVVRRTWATLIDASAEAMDLSESFPICWQRPSQANVRSTTHRRGRTSTPFAVSDRLTICSVQSPILSSAPRSFGRVNPPSAKTCRSQGQAWRMDFRTAGAPVAVLDVGGMNHQPEQEADGVDDDVALASLNVLGGVKAANTSTFGGFDALAVDHPCARHPLAPFQFPRRAFDGERKAHRLQQTAIAPVVVNTAARSNRAGSPSVAAPTGTRSSRCRGSRSSPPAEGSFADDRAGAAAA